ncbi:MAG: hypothetical protein NTY76_08170 [Candidatus Omnitrophica bacterium]|nr:hypothetical protein [Candidatus Omnitrophota bacterium]
MKKEQKALRDCVVRWNGAHAEKNKISLHPLFFKTDVPNTSADSKDKRTQGVINQYLVTPSDWLVVVFKNKIGSDTGKSISGTIEEIEIFQKDYPERPISIYFYKRTHNPKIRQYKRKWKGIWKEYRDSNELEYEFFIDISHMVNKNTYFRQKFIDPTKKIEERAQILISEVSGDVKQLAMVSKLTEQELKIETNGCRFIGYEMAFEHLCKKRLMEKADAKGEVYILTSLGKQYVEAIKNYQSM